jgi:hypothetical protein
MSAHVLSDVNKHIIKIQERLPSGENNYSQLKLLFIITSDKKEKEISEEFLKTLTKTKDILISEKNIPEENLREIFQNVKKALIRTNSMFNLVKNVFSFDGMETERVSAKVQIDDDDVLDFLSNMQKCQKLMQYITDIVPAILEMQELHKAKPKEYRSEELVKMFNMS